MDIQIPNGHWKSMPTWLIIKMQIQNIIRYHITQARMASLNRLETINAWESVGKGNPPTPLTEMKIGTDSMDNMM